MTDKTKTIIVFSDTSEMYPRYFVVDGDKRHLHEVLINGDSDEKDIDELNAIVYDENWYYRRSHSEFPAHLFNMLDPVYVIHAGFLA